MDRSDIQAALDRARHAESPRLEALGFPGPVDVVGLVPGSFDPMTVAHAALGAALAADLVLFVYSPATLPKEAGPGGDPEPPLLPEEDRLASLVAYCRDRPGLGVALCSHGLLADQADAAARAFPRSRFVFGVGSDKVVQVFDPRWYPDRELALDRLFGLAEVTYAVRGVQAAVVEDALAEARSPWRARVRPVAIDPALAGVSSRAVRGAVRGGGDVAGLIPTEVLPFVRRAAARR